MTAAMKHANFFEKRFILWFIKTIQLKYKKLDFENFFSPTRTPVSIWDVNQSTIQVYFVLHCYFKLLSL